MPTVDRILAERRRARERTGDVRPADLSDLLTRLTVGGARPTVYDQQGGDGQPTWDELIDLGWGNGGGGGGGGGSWGSSQAGAATGQQYALDMLGREQSFAQAQFGREEAARAQAAQLQRAWEESQGEAQREFERQQDLERRKAERLRIFSEMRNSGDLVGAVLFAMGIGGEDVGGQFADLPPIAGAEAYGGKVESGLESLLGGKMSIGKEGVAGLPSIVKSATAYSAGQAPGGRNVGALQDARTLLESAYKVGTPKGKAGPGMSREEQLRKIASVTPQGAF